MQDPTTTLDTYVDNFDKLEKQLLCEIRDAILADLRHIEQKIASIEQTKEEPCNGQ